MKNISSKMEKIFVIMGIFLVSSKNKILALSPNEVKPSANKEDWYIYDDYTSQLSFFKGATTVFIVSFIILIGLLIYLKRKNDAKNEKRIKILKVLLVIILLPVLIITGLITVIYIFKI